ncbi:NAD(P)/FAD-dependent oxidoreductase [Lignipirellula cremea]|uniref:D-amino acid dehydrogenase small subunit n=1 Tax=Lignipirellula cremea TaxID=2528010 RepID=A0A518DW52_9BACT|nr:NAD(P)-binding protein [Lignipirellula cremea]QDU96065.1 D-amino acid dehydrogenase small subunit [Lignipirellula cremea]
MPLRLTNLELPVEESEEKLRALIAARLDLDASEPFTWRILRKSLDARTRDALRFVYTLTVSWPGEADWLASHAGKKGVERFEPTQFVNPPPGSTPLPDRPVVVGSGPAGLLAAYYLAARGYRPLILERGDPVKERVPAIRDFDSGGPVDRQNNYLFGEGGAGTFSDGKLTCRLSGPEVDWVLERFVECGGKPEIRYEQRPHLGSNRLPMLVRNFRRKIEELDGEYRFRCQMEELDLVDGRVQGINTSSGYIRTSVVVLAIGHSARDTYEMLHRLGVPMERKAFQLGLRIEQPQEQVNRHKYRRDIYEPILGAADYTLSCRGERDLFTFCMCAGGMVIPSVSEPGMFCTNGMSNSRHDTPFANSGVMVTLEPGEFGSDHPLAGVHLQRQFEAAAFELARGTYQAPIQRASDFLASRAPDPAERLESSYPRGVTPAALDSVLPASVISALRAGLPVMDRQWRGDFLKNATLVGPEMRGSSPVRIARERESRQTPGIPGLFPVGEGAGYAGGIISAAVDGLLTARQIVQDFASPG